MFLILGFVLLLASGMKGFEIQSTRFQYENLHRHLGSNRASSIKENWITQKLDNFDPTNTETFKQQYYTDDQFFKPKVGRDIYIEVGGEWDVELEGLDTSLTYQLCRENGGFYVAPEHRFYGQSFPDNYQSDQIKFLSVQQAIQDLENLIEHIKFLLGLANARIILTGCSYAGAIVTWLKKKHAEELDYIVWSSSGPIFAKADFYEYSDAVSVGVKHFGGEDCFNNVRAGFDKINELIMSDNIDELKRLMKDSPLASYNFKKPIWHDSFYIQLIGAFAEAIQYNGQKAPYIQDICAKIANSADLVTGIYDVYVDFTGGPKPFKTRAEGNPDASWEYQTCSAFGWFQTYRTSPDSILPIDISTAVKENNCRAHFKITKKEIQANVDKTNAQYGGYHPGIASNLLSTLGEYDPWRPVNLQSSPDVVTPILLVKEGSHCSDYSYESPYDTDGERETKTQIKKIINMWLSG